MAYRKTMQSLAKQEFLSSLPHGVKEVDHDDRTASPRLEAWHDEDKESDD